MQVIKFPATVLLSIFDKEYRAKSNSHGTTMERALTAAGGLRADTIAAFVASAHKSNFDTFW